jgi:hypothetical protein
LSCRVCVPPSVILSRARLLRTIMQEPISVHRCRASAVATDMSTHCTVTIMSNRCWHSSCCTPLLNLHNSSRLVLPAVSVSSSPTHCNPTTTPHLSFPLLSFPSSRITIQHRLFHGGSHLLLLSSHPLTLSLPCRRSIRSLHWSRPLKHYPRKYCHRST